LLSNDSDPENDTLTVTTSPVPIPANGSLMLYADGSFSYTHDGSETTSDSFVYEVCDSGSLCNTATVNLIIISVNDPPVATDDTGSVTEGGTLSEPAPGLLSNDSDPENDTLAVTLAPVSDPINGLLTLNTDGSYSYTHNGSETTSDSFVYKVCDSEPICDTATVNLTITPGNKPVANADTASVDEDDSVNISILGNDDFGGDGPSTSAITIFTPPIHGSTNTTCVTGCTAPVNGILINNNDGTFSYTPNFHFSGIDNFVYEICDTDGSCDTTAVNITINSVIDPPIANDYVTSTNEGTPVIIDVASNDMDPDGDLNPASANTNCAINCAGSINGTLFNNNDGTFTYTPDLNFSGIDHFVYEICDTGGLCDVAAARITVNPADFIIFEIRVAGSSDDAEERSSGRISLTSSDLELVNDKIDQTVGMRFNNLNLEQGSNITQAYIQFQADEISSGNISLTIQGQNSDHAESFSRILYDISSRPTTSVSVSWSPPAWNTVGEADLDQRTPDISSIIQEIINRPGWVNGNSIVIIITGSGKRTAESFNGKSDAAPLLHIEYGEPEPPPQFSCLAQQGPLISLIGVQIERFDKRWDPLAENMKIDARAATWTAQWPVQEDFDDPVQIAGGPGICFSGGTIQGNYPEQIDNDPHSTWDYLHGTSGMDVYAENTTIEGTRIHNYGDGIDFDHGPSSNFVINGVHLSHIRDDCVENDSLYSGLIDDSLFDGCYTAFSARTSLGQNPPAQDGSNNLWTIRNSLIRLEPMWGVYKNRGPIPGHGGWFKWDSSGISPRLALHNNIFRVDQDANHTGLGIPSGKLESCSNNTVVWLGSGSYPDPLPTTFNNQPCFTITTDPSVWDNAVANWLSTH
jgi:hypothetical protein